VATYLTLTGFKGLTTIPAVFVDEVEKVAPGWIDAQIDYWSRWIDSRLRKRYASPFAAYDATPPTPLAVQGWIARIVTVRVWLKRGVDPNDLQFDVINVDATSALEEIAEAANSDTGLYDLPLRVDEDGTALSRGTPRSYSEASPYVWTDRQSATARNEDDAQGGTFG